MRNLKLFLLLTFSVLIYASCVKKKNYPVNPEIGFKAFYPFSGDTADLVITFSDGDGDIGKAQEDPTKNLFITFQYFNTTTQNFMSYYNNFLNDTVRMDYTIRKPKDNYDGKPISGEVAVRLNEYRPDNTYKRIRYVMYLVDNSGNKSNVLTTPELLVP